MTSVFADDSSVAMMSVGNRSGISGSTLSNITSS